MTRRLPLDAIDSKSVFRLYVAVVGPVGVFVALWGSAWLGGSLNGQPLGIASLTRMTGAAIVAAAIWAYTASTIANPIDRRRNLGWFVVAHLMLLLMAWPQVFAVWGDALPRPAWWLFNGLLAATVYLLGGFVRHGGDAAPLGVYMGLFGTPPPAASTLLRADHEDQMREAGAQEERNRLARDLHDSVKQQIFAIQAAAATAERRLESDANGAHAAIAQIRDAARESMAEMDAMLDQLRVAAVENAGLVEALKKQCEALEFRTGAKVSWTSGPLPPNQALPPGAHQALLRIAQEALSNVARHARAQHVAVSLRTIGDQLVLRVEDDGQGYVPNTVQRGLGLDNIRDRAAAVGGNVELTSDAGHGTVVVASVPFAADDPRAYFRKAMYGLAAACVVGGLASQRGGLSMLPLAVPMVFDTGRYLVAWRRARRLQAAAA